MEPVAAAETAVTADTVLTEEPVLEVWEVADDLSEPAQADSTAMKASAPIDRYTALRII
jgi:hypothetical protein